MYKNVKVLNKISIFEYSNDFIYVYDFKNKENINFRYCDLRFKSLWELEIGKLPFISFHQDVFIIGNNSENYTTIFSKYSNKELIKYDINLPSRNGFPYSTMNDIIFFKNDDKLTGINLKNWEFTKRVVSKDLGFVLNVQDKFIFRIYGKGILVIYDNEINNILWQRDFSEECKYIDTWNDKEYMGSVQHIYPYGDDKIIVCCKRSYCFCLDICTGEEIWKNDFSSWMTFDYENDIGYSYSNGGSIAKIDLKTGNILNKDGKYFSLPDLPEYNDCHISPNTYTMVYHDGLLWGLVYGNGYSFIVGINPHDWHYEWIHRVETIGKLMDIKFHKNRMYLQDSEGDLHIYLKE